MSCPICTKETTDKYRPFCSKRCADVDLGKWLNGSYAVASVGEDDDDELANALQTEVKWSGKFGQRAKMYPTRTNGYENDKTTELFRPV